MIDPHDAKARGEAGQAVVGFIMGMRAGCDDSASAIAASVGDYHSLFVVCSAMLMATIEGLAAVTGADAEDYLQNLALAIVRDSG